MGNKIVQNPPKGESLKESKQLNEKIIIKLKKKNQIPISNF
jgi:hypothetical protein